METEVKLLYDYTKAIASGVAISDEYLKTILPNLYLDNKLARNELPALIYTNDYPKRYSHAYSSALSKIGESFGVFRSFSEPDDLYRQRIKMYLIKSPTNKGIKNSIETVFSGISNRVIADVKPAHEDFFDAVSNNFSSPFRGRTGSRTLKITIEIFPEIKTSVNFYVDRVYAGVPYKIKKSGIYSIVFDPDGLFNLNSRVSLIKKTTKSFQSNEVKLTNRDYVPQKSTIDLGFLTKFNELRIESPDVNLILDKYYASLRYENSSFTFYKNPAYNVIGTAFGVLVLSDIFSEILSSGVVLEKLIIHQTGTGG